MSRLQAKFKKEILPKLKERFSEKNAMQLPRLRKIIISMGVAEAAKDKTLLQSHIDELSLISSQRPVMTKAKKAISNFKLKIGQVTGLKVTLRKKRMYDFLDRFCNIVCPRIRDFRGFKVHGDGSGNYNLGIDDQQVFPEVNLDKVKRVQGMNITLVTSAENDAECTELLTLLGFPFKKDKES